MDEKGVSPTQKCLRLLIVAFTRLLAKMHRKQIILPFVANMLCPATRPVVGSCLPRTPAFRFPFHFSLRRPPALSFYDITDLFRVSCADNDADVSATKSATSPSLLVSPISCPLSTIFFIPLPFAEGLDSAVSPNSSKCQWVIFCDPSTSLN